MDLNRPREKAVYRTPADAWGLRVWRSDPGEDLISASLAEYDAFYSYVHGVLTDVRKRHGIFVVFDLHSYNHRRDGPDASPADPAANPEVNIGTASMDRDRWAPVVGRFIADLRRFDFPRAPSGRPGKRQISGRTFFPDGSTSNFRTLVAPLPSSSRSSSWTNDPVRSFPPTTRRSWRLCDRPSPVCSRKSVDWRMTAPPPEAGSDHRAVHQRGLGTAASKPIGQAEAPCLGPDPH